MIFLAKSKHRGKPFYRFFCGLILFTFTLNSTFSPAYAQVIAQNFLNLPAVGTMLPLTPPFTPVYLKGLKIHPENPLRFDFIVNPGDSELQGEALKEEATKLIKYFLASLTIPEEDLWVNLSPYEKNRIIADSFGQTEMGRDLLAQDYILKQLTASLTHPEKELGVKFWDRVRREAKQKFGTDEIPMDTFNKIWIVPERAAVYEHEGYAFMVDSYLKVMLEEDFEAMEHANVGARHALPLQSSILQEIIVPAIEVEVNTGKNFANLRQIYNALILAVWYKKNLKESLLGRVYVDQKKIKGIDLEDPTAKEKIYQQYLEALKKGVYNYIKEDYNADVQEIVPRQYFSGGNWLSNTSQILTHSKGDIALLPSADRAMAMAAIGKNADSDVLTPTDLVENTTQQQVTQASVSTEAADPAHLAKQSLAGEASASRQGRDDRAALGDVNRPMLTETRGGKGLDAHTVKRRAGEEFFIGDLHVRVQEIDETGQRVQLVIRDAEGSTEEKWVSNKETIAARREPQVSITLVYPKNRQEQAVLLVLAAPGNDLFLGDAGARTIALKQAAIQNFIDTKIISLINGWLEIYRYFEGIDFWGGLYEIDSWQELKIYLEWLLTFLVSIMIDTYEEEEMMSVKETIQGLLADIEPELKKEAGAPEASDPAHLAKQSLAGEASASRQGRDDRAALGEAVDAVIEAVRALSAETARRIRPQIINWLRRGVTILMPGAGEESGQEETFEELEMEILKKTDSRDFVDAFSTLILAMIDNPGDLETVLWSLRQAFVLEEPKDLITSTAAELPAHPEDSLGRGMLDPEVSEAVVAVVAEVRRLENSPLAFGSTENRPLDLQNVVDVWFKLISESQSGIILSGELRSIGVDQNLIEKLVDLKEAISEQFEWDYDFQDSILQDAKDLFWERYRKGSRTPSVVAGPAAEDQEKSASDMEARPPAAAPVLPGVGTLPPAGTAAPVILSRSIEAILDRIIATMAEFERSDRYTLDQVNYWLEKIKGGVTYGLVRDLVFNATLNPVFSGQFEELAEKIYSTSGAGRQAAGSYRGQLVEEVRRVLGEKYKRIEQERIQKEYERQESERQKAQLQIAVDKVMGVVQAMEPSRRLGFKTLSRALEGFVPWEQTEKEPTVIRSWVSQSRDPVLVKIRKAGDPLVVAMMELSGAVVAAAGNEEQIRNAQKQAVSLLESGYKRLAGGDTADAPGRQALDSSTQLELSKKVSLVMGDLRALRFPRPSLQDILKWVDDAASLEAGSGERVRQTALQATRNENFARRLRDLVIDIVFYAKRQELPAQVLDFVKIELTARYQSEIVPLEESEKRPPAQESWVVEISRGEVVKVWFEDAKTMAPSFELSWPAGIRNVLLKDFTGITLANIGEGDSVIESGLRITRNGKKLSIIGLQKSISVVISPSPTADPAAIGETIDTPRTLQSEATPVGGIYLNPAMMDLQIKRDGEGVPLSMELQPIQDMNIEGFYPVIINVVPINLPLILGFAGPTPSESLPGQADLEKNKYYRDEEKQDEKLTVSSVL